MKFLLFLLLLFISTRHLYVDAMQGGLFYGITEVPYQAQLYFEKERGFITYCGASIVSEYWLVSAAHCVGKEDTLTNQVRVGSSSTAANGDLLNVTKIIVHGDYDEIYGWDCDICLIKVATPIEFNEYRQPIPIARQSPKVGDIVTVSGFGDLHYKVQGATLQIGRVPVISKEICSQNYSSLTNKMFCTSSADIDLCFGDSGSPAAINGELVGVASQGCEYTAPNVFTDVSRFYNWILHHTGITYD